MFDTVVFFIPVIQSTKNPYIDVLIGMAVTVIVFYPMNGIFQNYSGTAVGHYIRRSKAVHKNRIAGIVIGYVVGMTLIFIAFMYVKFRINVFERIFDWVAASF